MLTDRFHGRHSTDSSPAIAAFEDAVFAVAAHRPLGDSLTRALAADPELLSAHVLNGFGQIMLGRSETLAAASCAHRGAVQIAAMRPAPTASETALLDALGHAVNGRLFRAAARLEAHLYLYPEDFLSGKIAHALRFMLGDGAAMLRLSGSLSARAPKDGAGYGFLLGCHAFGLEEAGAYREAEAVGRQAVRLQPADSWGLHAVSHVFEMNGRMADGIDWLEGSRPVWSRCNNFSFHMAWHLGLLHLEAGDECAVLGLYDEEIRPVQSDDFRDIANAASMLWRLEQEGIDVGGRWDGLHDIAVRRRKDCSYVFASLHYLLALLASGDRDAAGELLAALRHRAAASGDDQAHVAASIGVPLAEALIGTPGSGGASQCSLQELAKLLPELGGSNAQRDVFLRSLMKIAAERRDHISFRAVAELRRGLRREDRFHRELASMMNELPRPAGKAIRVPLPSWGHAHVTKTI